MIVIYIARMTTFYFLYVYFMTSYALWLLMIVMLNPVALFLYLSPLSDKLSYQAFLNIVWKATVISWLIYMFFIVSGDFIFLKIFQIDFNSFRLFWWIVIFSLAFRFILSWKESFIKMKESLDDMAAQLALPFMVWAWSISVSILIGNAFSLLHGVVLLIIVLLLNGWIIMLIKHIQLFMETKRHKEYFTKILSIVFRLNSFFMGAIGVDMVITWIQWLFGL